MKKNLTICFAILVCFSIEIFAQVSTNVLVQISKAEDELRYDKTLENLMKSPDEKIRQRAALAAGRIGDEKAVPMLADLLDKDLNAIGATAAFAIGEIESIKGADAILKTLKNEKVRAEVRARATEAAGKIAAANAKDAKAIELGAAILDVLDAEIRNRKFDRLTVLLGLTAVLRARPEEGDFVTAKFLTNTDARIRADAANTLSRLRAKNANEPLRAMLLADDDAIVRANAARALGAAEDKDAFTFLLEAATEDADSRVRVSAIRSLGNLKDKRAADKLLQRGEMLLAAYKKSKSVVPNEKSELLEIATTLGRILQDAPNEKAVSFLGEFREADGFQSPETEIALVRVFSVEYPVDAPDFKKMFAPTTSLARFAKNTRVLSSFIQGFGEAANTAATVDNKGWRDNSADVLRKFIKDSIFLDAKIDRKTAAFVTPDALRGFANFKTDDLAQILRGSIEHKDVFVRATAAELLGDTTPSKENVEGLKAAFSAITLQELMPDKEYNDAQLAIITALAKQDKEKQEIKLLFPIALQAPDFLVRRHTASVIKQYGLEMESPATEAVTYVNVVMSRKSKKSTKLGQILNTNADYTRAVSRKNAKAILTTDKGIFTIDL